MALCRFVSDRRILILPLFVLLAFFGSVGPSLWITALNVKYRNFRYNYSVNRAIWPLYIAGRVQFERGASAIPAIVFA